MFGELGKKKTNATGQKKAQENYKSLPESSNVELVGIAPLINEDIKLLDGVILHGSDPSTAKNPNLAREVVNDAMGNGGMASGKSELKTFYLTRIL